MNEQKFTGKADLYEKYRPSYPDGLIDYLYDNARCDSVADIGAGTGKFTRCLMKKPWKVTAVEPNADMRGKLAAIEGITVVNAPAENTGLADKSVGLVTAAQAFHWFDREKFAAECKRILADGGKLAVVWNGFVEEGLAARQTELCEKYSIELQIKKAAGDDSYKSESDEFLRNEYFKSVEVAEYSGERVFDRESFIGETLSRSYAPKHGEPHYEPFAEELNALFSEFESGGTAVVKTTTICYLGSF